MGWTLSWGSLVPAVVGPVVLSLFWVGGAGAGSGRSGLGLQEPLGVTVSLGSLTWTVVVIDLLVAPAAVGWLLLLALTESFHSSISLIISSSSIISVSGTPVLSLVVVLVVIGVVVVV